MAVAVDTMAQVLDQATTDILVMVTVMAMAVILLTMVAAMAMGTDMDMDNTTTLPLQSATLPLSSHLFQRLFRSQFPSLCQPQHLSIAERCTVVK